MLFSKIVSAFFYAGLPNVRNCPLLRSLAFPPRLHLGLEYFGLSALWIPFCMSGFRTFGTALYCDAWLFPQGFFLGYNIAGFRTFGTALCRNVFLFPKVIILRAFSPLLRSLAFPQGFTLGYNIAGFQPSLA